MINRGYNISVFIVWVFLLTSLCYPAKNFSQTTSNFSIAQVVINSCLGYIEVSVQSNPADVITYQWYEKDTNGNYVLIPDETTRILFASPGEYRIVVTNTNTNQTISGNYVLNSSFPLQGTDLFSGLICSENANSGAILVYLDNGSSPYQYTLTDSNGSTVAQGNTSQGQETILVENLAVGTYTLNWEDSFGCTGTLNIDVDIPAQLNATHSTTSPLCFGGTGGMTFSVNGGWGADYKVQLLNPQGTPVVLSGYTAITTNDGIYYDIGNGQNIVVSGLLVGTYELKFYDEPLKARYINRYSFDVTNTTACIRSESIEITEPDELLVESQNATVTNSTCFEADDGSIQITPTGGTSPYSFSWSASNGGAIPAGQANSDTLTNIPAGTYTVTVTDDNGCQFTDSYTTTQPDQLTIGLNTFTNVSCNGGSDGELVVQVEGGTPNYSFTVNGATAIPTSSSGNLYTFSGLAAGNYTISVTDANNCAVSPNPVSQAIAEPVPLSHTINDFALACFDDTNGVIDGTISGGTAPYSIINDQTNQTVVVTTDGGAFSFTGLLAGNYTFTITDANSSTGDAGCSDTASANVTQPTRLLASANTTNSTCFEADDGSIQITPTGGTSPYSFSWSASNGGAIPAGQANSDTLTNIPAGTYTVTVTDDNGCQFTDSYTTTQPDQLTIGLNTFTNVSCNGGSDGELVVQVEGGTPNYSFTVNGATAIPTSSSGNLYTFSGLAAGNYTISVTDANNCAVSPNPVSQAIAEPVPLSHTINDFALACFDDTNGVIDGTISGGTAPYSIINDQTNQTVVVTTDGGAFSFTGLLAGNYTFTITDANSSTGDAGCSDTASANVTQPSAINVSETVTNITCFEDDDGAIQLTTSGGTAPYSYAWSTTNGSITPGEETTNSLTNLPPGTYTVTVTDDNGCQFTNAYIITEPSAISVNSNVSTFDSGSGATINVSCNGASDGFINITPSGGTAPYTYQWTASNGGSVAGQTNAQNLSGLIAGTYSLYLIDANNCSTTESIDLIQPRILSGSATVTQDNVCYDGALGVIETTIDNTGSVDGINYTYTISGANLPTGYTSSETTTALSQRFQNLPAGTFTITVTDANGCAFTTAQQTIAQPSSPITISETITDLNGFNISCFGQTNASITLSVTGGTPATGGAPYTYQWTSPSGATIPAGQENTNSLSGIGSGTYEVTVADGTGVCLVTQSYTITEPTAISLSGTTSDYNGFGVSAYNAADGSIDLTVTGGIDTKNYTYSWTTSNGTIPSGQEFLEDPSGLTEGTYTVIVTDDNNCSETASFTLSEPLELLISEVAASHQDVDCFGDSTGIIEISIDQESVPPYDYVLSLSGTTVQSINTNATSHTFTNLVAGTYDITVTDDNGVSKILNSIVISQPASGLAIDSATISNFNGFGISCNNFSDGSIDLLISGGYTPYTYTWTASNGTNLSAVNAPNLTGLASGSYTVVITDATGNCSITQSYTITEPTAISLSGTTSDYNGFGVSAFNAADGSIDLTVTGGIDTKNYTYSWTTSDGTIPSGQEFLEDPSGLTEGTYTVIVTDDNNCSETASFTLSEPLELLISEVAASHQDVDCFGDSTGIIEISIDQESVPPYDYVLSLSGTTVQSINTNATSHTFTNLVAGTYDITVTDDNGVSKILNSIVISQPASGLAIDSATISNFNGFGISCNNFSDGSIDLLISGGYTPYTYTWTASNGTNLSAVNAPNLTGLASGSYTVVITDATGNCSITQSYTITEPTAISLSGTTSDYNGFGVSAFNAADGSIDLTVTGGIDTKNYTYSWTTSDGTIPSGQETFEDLSGLTEGTYTVIVTDDNNCFETASFTLSEPLELLISEVAASHQDVDCFGDSTGIIEISIDQESVPPYDYVLSLSGTTVQSINTNATSHTFTNLVAGTYDITVTDDNGVSKILNSIVISQPASAFTGVVSTSSFTGPNGTFQISCFGSAEGAIDIALSGGTPFDQGLPTEYYNYELTNSAGTVVSNGQGTTINFPNLIADTYTFTAQDATGNCTVNETITISQPNELIMTTDFFQDMQCFGANDGIVNVTLSGGLGNYSYNWTKDSNPFSTQEDISGLEEGTYVLMVEDLGTNSCTISQTYTITEPAELLVSLNSKTDVLCFGDATGAIDINVAGGIAPYQFAWTHSSGTNYTTEDLINVPAGIYNLIVTDNNNCAKSLQVELTQPNEILFNTTKTDISCYGYNDGSITINPTGGIPPYSISWSDLGNGTSRTNLSPGVYTATIIDANGCVVSEDIDVIDAPIFSLQGSTSTNISCFGANDGSISLTITGGVAPLQLTWSDDPSAGIQRNNLSSGIYNVEVVGADNCIQNASFVINEPQELSVSAVVVDAIDCTDPNSGSIDVTVVGGTLPYSFAWNNGATTEDLIGIPANNYSVTITDANGCSVSGTYQVIRQDPLTATISTNIQADCDTKEVIQENEALVSGGFPPYTISWSYGDVDSTNPAIMRTNIAGVAVVTITDNNGCTLTQNVTNDIKTIGDPDFTMASAFHTDYSIWAIEDPITFTNTSSGDAQSFLWDFGEGNTSTDENPTHTYAKEGTYQITLTVTYSYGCSYSVSYTIVVGKGYEIEMPNGFTPNGDGVNDVFRPVYLGMKEVKLSVYDTWGGLLYTETSTSNTFNGWNGTVDGKPLENGNYIFQVEAISRNDIEIQKTGPFALIK